MSKSESVRSNARKILNYALQNEAVGARVTKQAAFDAMSDKGYTPSVAFETRLKSSAKTDLSQSGLTPETVENVKALLERLDTAFASAWYGSDGVTSAKNASSIYVKSVASADAVSAVSIASKALNNESLSKGEISKIIKKANKLLPTVYKIDTEIGTDADNAAQIIDAANEFISEISSSAADVSQNYMDNIVDVINETQKSVKVDDNNARAAIVDILTTGNVDANINTVLSDAQATEFLSEVLGIYLDSKTTRSEVVRKVRNMLNTYKAGKGAEFNSVAKQKKGRAKAVLVSLTNAGITDSDIIDGFKNSIYNRKLTKKQAKAIAENEKAFNLYINSTGGVLNTKSTLQNMMDAADLVAGFKMSGELSPYYSRAVTEIVESDTLVPDGEVGIFDSDTGRIILNKNAATEQKMAYLLAHEILTEGENSDNIETKGADNNVGTDTGILEGREISTSDRRNYSIREQSTNSAKLTEYLGNVGTQQGESQHRTGESGWLVPQELAQSDLSGSEKSIFRTVSEIEPSGSDTIGRVISSEIIRKFKNTAFKDENGNLLSLYHWTKEKFTTFNKGDVGFHFGTLDAAHDRYSQTKEEFPDLPIGNYKEVYLNITNPIELNDESGVWDPAWVAIQLLEKGIISELQFENLGKNAGFYDNTYDNPAAEAVRNILKQNGYDGIIYKNASEDKGSISVIALYPDQIITVAENGVDIIDTETYDPDFRLEGGGKLHFDRDRSKLTQLQRGSLKALEAYADAIGLDIYIETDTDKNINGWLDSKGIHISLEAGSDAKGTLLFTAAHELAHFIKRTVPDKWNTFAEFIIRNFADNDISTGKLIRDRQAKAKKMGITLSNEQALEEVVADACETMLLDGSAMEKLSELHRNDATLYERIKYFLSNLAAKIKKLYDGLKPNSAEARYVSQMNDTAAKLQQMFNDALYDAAESYRHSDELQKNANDDTVVYSLSNSAENEIEKALLDKKYSKEIKLTDTSPSILIGQKGVRNLPMLMNASHIRENIFTEQEAKSKGLKINKNINYHGLGKELFLDVIDNLDNVTEAYRGTKNADNPDRRENYFLLISQYADKNGNIINVPVYINENGIYNKIFIDTNKIATVYGKTEIRKYIRAQLQKGNLVRIKKEVFKPVNRRRQLTPIME